MHRQRWVSSVSWIRVGDGGRQEGAVRGWHWDQVRPGAAPSWCATWVTCRILLGEGPGTGREGEAVDGQVRGGRAWVILVVV